MKAQLHRAALAPQAVARRTQHAAVQCSAAPVQRPEIRERIGTAVAAAYAAIVLSCGGVSSELCCRGALVRFPPHNAPPVYSHLL